MYNVFYEDVYRGRFKNAYGVVGLGALKSSYLNIYTSFNV